MSDWNATLQKLRKSKSLHQAIRSGDIDTVQQLSIDEQNPGNSYMLGGKSPLTVALEAKKFRIFSNLLLRGISLDEDCMKILSQLSNSEKNEIRSCNILSNLLEAKKFKIYAQLLSCGISLDDNCGESLKKLSAFEKKKIGEYNFVFAKNLRNANIYFLLSNVKECFGSNTIDGKKSAAVEQLFISLNDIESIRPLLKAVKLIGQLEITFDFNSDNIQCMWPFSDAEGLTIVQRKKILIAANGCYNEISDFIFHDACNAKGTIIHEITHFVMENLYENSGKPYYRLDEKRRKMFEQITAELRNFEIENSTIEEIFRLYRKTQWESELIARASELIVKFSEDANRLKLIKENAAKLFQFHDETLKHVDSFDNSKWSIRELNRTFKAFEELVNSKILFKNSVEKIEISNDIKVIASNAPLFCMAHTMNDFSTSPKFDVDACVIFCNFDLFREKAWDVINAHVSSDKTVLVVNCENISKEEMIEALAFLEGAHMSSRVILITREMKFQGKLEKVKCETRNYVWKDLELSTQELILDRPVNFQSYDKKIKLSQIITTESEACNFIPLQTTFTNKLVIDKSLSTSYDDFCLPRDFLIGRKQIERGTINFIWEDIEYDELLSNTNLRKVLISDIAGTGKTVILEKVAETLKNLYPEGWVELLNLKNYTTELKQVENSCETLNFLSLLEKVFKRDINDLEREILTEHYKNGKFIILLDSFDEISPNYKKIAKVFIEKFESGIGNLLCVATRPHLEDELESSCGFTVVKLKELTKHSQINFLMQSWGKVDEKTKKKAKKLISQLQKLDLSKSGYVGYPMLMKMVADIHGTVVFEDKEDFNYFSIYDKFWKKHISKWGSSSEVAEDERNELEYSCAQRCSKVHQILAIKNIFGSNYAKKYLKVDEEWTDEKILRIGIVKSIKSCKFIHETFAEYFVAVFIENSLGSSKNENFEEVVKIIKTVVLGYGHRVIRRFLNENLKKIKISDQARGEIKSMIRGLSPRELSYFLYFLREEDLEVVLDLFQLQKFESKAIMSLLQSPKFNYVHLSFSSNRGTFSRCLIKCLEALTPEDQKRMLEPASKIGDPSSYSKTSFNIFHSCFENPYGLDPTVLEYLERVFSEMEIVAMLIEKPEETPAYCILTEPIYFEKSENSFFVENSCRLLKKYLDSDQIKNLLFGDGIRGSSCLNFAAKFGNKFAINSIFDFAEEIFGRKSDELRNILKASDSEDKTLLIMNLKNNKHDCSYEALRSNLSKNGLSPEEIKKLVTNSSSENVVDCLVNSRKIEKAYSIFLRLFPHEKLLNLLHKCLSKSISFDPFGSFVFFAKKHSEIWEELETFISKDEIRKLIIQTYNGCKNPAFELTDSKFKTHMEKHFSILENYLDDDEIIELLLNGNSGKNTVTHIVDNLSSGKIEIFFEIMQRFGSDLSRKLFLSSDASGDNIFHASARSTFSTVICLMKNQFDDEDIRELLLSTNNSNESVFHLVFPQFYEVEKLLSEVLGRGEIKNLIMNEENYGVNVANNLIMMGYGNFEKKLEILEKYFSNEELVEFLLRENESGSRILFDISSRPTEFTQFFIDTKKFGRELSSKLFSTVDKTGDNIFRGFVRNWNSQAFLTVLRVTNESCGREIARKLLFSCDKDDFCLSHFVFEKFYEIEANLSTILERGEIKNLFMEEEKRSGEMIEKLFAEGFGKLVEKLAVLGKYFTDEEQVDILLKYSKYGRNVVTHLASSGSLCEIGDFFVMTRKFGQKLSLKLLSAVDEKGNNVFHAATMLWNFQNFMTVLRLMNEYVEKENIRELLISKNKSKFSFLHYVLGSFYEIEDQLSAFLTRDDMRHLIMHEENLTPLADFGKLAENLTCLQKYFTNEELVESQRSKSSKSVMTHFINFASVSEVKNFFKISKKFEDGLSLKLFSDVDCRRNNIFHVAASRKEIEVFSTVLRLMKESYGDGEVKKLLLSFNSNNESVLFRLFFNLVSGKLNSRQEEPFINESLEIMINEIGIEELKRMLFFKTTCGYSCEIISKDKNSRSIFDKLKQLGIDIESEDRDT